MRKTRSSGIPGFVAQDLVAEGGLLDLVLEDVPVDALLGRQGLGRERGEVRPRGGAAWTGGPRDPPR